MKNKFFKHLKLSVCILLALTMVFSLITAVSCSCSKSASTTETTSSSEKSLIPELTDEQTLTNGDFEFGTANTETASYPVYTSINWNRSNASYQGTSAPNSSYNSGIIDTRAYAYEYDEDGNVKLDKDGNRVLKLDEDGNPIPVFQKIAENNAFAKELVYNEDGTPVYVKDGTHPDQDYVDQYGNKKQLVKQDENGVDQYFNPHTPSYYGLTDYSEGNSKMPKNGGKILMIHNYYNQQQGRGTAQYFTSTSSLTLAPTENGLLELWVLTRGVESDNLTSLMEDVEYGAYVSVATKIGSMIASTCYVKNIDTSGNWVKISIYLQGNVRSNTTYTITLGLGFGGSKYKAEYVQGFAFFDDISFRKLDKDETLPEDTNTYFQLYYNEELQTEDQNYSFAGYCLDVPIVKNPTEGREYNEFIQENYDACSKLVALIDADKADYDVVLDGGTITPENVYPIGSDDFNRDANAVITDFEQLEADESDILFEADDQVLFFDYTNPSTISFTTQDFTVNSGEYLQLVFYVKTKLLLGSFGLTVKVIDKGADGTPAQFYDESSTTLLDNFITEESASSTTKNYTKVTFVAYNTYEGDELARNFALKFTLGATSTQDSILALPTGKAYITGFKQCILNKDESDNIEASNDKHVVKAQLKADLVSTAVEENTDTYNFNYGKAIGDIDIKTGVASNVLKYKGVVGNHNLVGGDQADYTQDATVSGIINSQFAETYSLNGLFGNFNGQVTEWFEQVKTNPAYTNEYVQALMIYNTEETSYGYIGEVGTMSASTTYYISVKVKIFGDATAYIYLTSDKIPSFEVLGVNETNEYTEQSVNERYCLAVTADMCNIVDEYGFAEIKFVIKTGAGKDEDHSGQINYKVELWNGSRDGLNASSGIVMFGSCEATSAADADSLLKDFEAIYANTEGDGGLDCTYATAVANQKLFTRRATKVIDDDHPNGQTVNYEATDEENTSIAYMCNGLFLYSDLTNVDAPTTIDNTTQQDSDSTSDDSDGDSNKPNVFLLISSMIVTIALIIALVAILVRKIITVVQNRKNQNASYYDVSSRDKTNEEILKRKAQSSAEGEQVTEEVVEEKEYDYDNPENNIEEEPTLAPAEEIDLSQTTTNFDEEVAEQNEDEQTTVGEDAEVQPEEVKAEEVNAEEQPAEAQPETVETVENKDENGDENK